MIEYSPDPPPDEATEAPDATEVAGPRKSRLGRLNRNLQPRPCSGCTHTLSLHCRILYMDTREYNESGVLPVITEANQHFIYLFCSGACLHAFMGRAIQRGDTLGLG